MWLESLAVITKPFRLELSVGFLLRWSWEDDFISPSPFFLNQLFFYSEPKKEIRMVLTVNLSYFNEQHTEFCNHVFSLPSPRPFGLVFD